MKELSIDQISQVGAGDSQAGEGLVLIGSGFGLALTMGAAITASALLPGVLVAVGAVMLGDAIYTAVTK